jgi:hypothetical protein
VKTYSLKILLLSSLALTIALAPVWTQPNPPESPPGSMQGLPLAKPSFTPEQEAWISQAFQAVSEAAAKAAVDKAVPLAVQAAVAEYAGKLAGAQAEKKAATRKAGLWRVLGLTAASCVVGTLFEGRVGQGSAWGAGIGAASGGVWYVAEHWPPWIN